MAITLFKAISVIGLKTGAFLQSLLPFHFGRVLQALKGLFNPGYSNPPGLPCSPFGSVASPSTKFHQEVVDINVAGGESDSDTTAISSSLPTGSAIQGNMASVPPIVPAVQRVLAEQKENIPLQNASPTDIDAQLGDELSRLVLGETGSTTSADPTLQQPAANGAGVITGKENGKDVVNHSSSPQKHHLPAGFATSDTVGREVTRAPAVTLTHSVSQTSKLKETSTIQLGGGTVQVQPKDETPEQAAQRAIHSRFMREALDMARLALRTNETPVGCVLVYKGRIIAKGMNATNVTRNGTRHAELMAISALLSYVPASDLETAGNNSSDKAASVRMPLSDRTNKLEHEDPSTWGDVDPSDGHLYPYGQKLHPSPRVDKTVINECTLYVTVEPCVMCASLLRQLGIKKVYFGAVNDKFGGTGGVFRIHQNSPYSAASAPPSPRPQYGKGLVRPVLEPRPASTDGQSHVEDDRRGERNVVVPDEPAILPGDGGNVERGFEAEGGWGRDEAVTLLRQFYVQENNRAPVPRKKEGRAARLAAMMERDGHAGGPMIGASSTPVGQENSGAGTPEADEPKADEVMADGAADTNAS